MAEGVRFELTRGLTLPVFKTGALNRSANLPLEKLETHYFVSIAGFGAPIT